MIPALSQWSFAQSVAATVYHFLVGSSMLQVTDITGACYVDGNMVQM